MIRSFFFFFFFSLSPRAATATSVGRCLNRFTASLRFDAQRRLTLLTIACTHRRLFFSFLFCMIIRCGGRIWSLSFASADRALSSGQQKGWTSERVGGWVESSLWSAAFASEALQYRHRQQQEEQRIIRCALPSSLHSTRWRIAGHVSVLTLRSLP